MSYMLFHFIEKQKTISFVNQQWFLHEWKTFLNGNKRPVFIMDQYIQLYILSRWWRLLYTETKGRNPVFEVNCLHWNFLTGVSASKKLIYLTSMQNLSLQVKQLIPWALEVTKHPSSLMPIPTEDFSQSHL